MVDGAAIYVDAHGVRSVVDAVHAGWVGVPPLLAVGVNLAVVNFCRAFVVEVGAAEGKPVVEIILGDDALYVGNVFGKVEAALQRYGDIGEDFSIDRGSGQVLVAIFEHDSAATDAVLESRVDGRSVVPSAARALDDTGIREIGPFRRGCRRRIRRQQRKKGRRPCGISTVDHGGRYIPGTGG